jgi:tRNA-specific adenosine deaminase 2
VGCLLVHQNKVIGRGRNEVTETKNATRHAEFVAVDRALEYFEKVGYGSGRYDLFAECDLYVSCEPCIMCAMALRCVP